MKFKLIFYTEQPEETVRKYLDLITRESYNSYYFINGLYFLYFEYDSPELIPTDSIRSFLKTLAVVILDENDEPITNFSSVRKVQIREFDKIEEEKLSDWSKVRNKFMSGKK